MASIETYLQEAFPVIKGLSFGVCFLIAAGIQFFWPHRIPTQRYYPHWFQNLSLGLFNSLLLSIVFAGSIEWFSYVSRFYSFGLFTKFSLPYLAQVILTVFVLDFLAYILHRIYHRISLFVPFHCVHHSDKFFETSTAVRFHPLEVLFSFSFRLSVIGLLGMPLLGLIIFEVLYIFLNLLGHSNFRFGVNLDKLIASLFITPSIHRVHHSNVITELNSNYGPIFSLWDRFFGTFNYQPTDKQYTIGLPRQQKAFTSLKSLLLAPFKNDYSTKTPDEPGA